MANQERHWSCNLWKFSNIFGPEILGIRSLQKNVSQGTEYKSVFSSCFAILDFQFLS